MSEIEGTEKCDNPLCAKCDTNAAWQQKIDELQMDLQQLRDDYDARGMALARLETEKELLERFTEELLKTIKEIGMRK
jgi:hypothetical protein